MDLETFITAVFCLADDFVRDLTLAGRLRRRGPEPPWPAWLVQTRRRIETVLGQLTERYHAKQVRACDGSHLARWARKFVYHTLAVLFCQRAGLSALAFAQLVRA